MIEFSAPIEQARGGGAYVEVPAVVLERLGDGGRIPVRARFDGIGYRGSIVRMGGVACIGVLKAIRDQIGKAPDDIVVVEVERDDEERTVDIPPELAVLFEDHLEARAIFDSMSFSHQREHVNHIAEAKRAGTRERRARKTIDALLGVNSGP